MTEAYDVVIGKPVEEETPQAPPTLDEIAESYRELEREQQSVEEAGKRYSTACNVRVEETIGALKKAMAIPRRAEEKSWTKKVGEDKYTITREDGKLAVIITHEEIQNLSDAPRRTVLEYKRSLEARVEYGRRLPKELSFDEEMKTGNRGVVKTALYSGIIGGIAVAATMYLTHTPIVVPILIGIIGAGAIGSISGVIFIDQFGRRAQRHRKEHPYAHELALKKLSRLSPDAGRRELVALERVPALLAEAHATWYDEQKETLAQKKTAYEDGALALTPEQATEPKCALEMTTGPISDNDIPPTR